MSYKDLNKQREFQRKWVAQRRAQFFIGKKCSECGSENELLLRGNRRKDGNHSFFSCSYAKREQLLKKIRIICATCYGGEVKIGTSMHARRDRIAKLRSEIGEKYLEQLKNTKLKLS